MRIAPPRPLAAGLALALAAALGACGKGGVVSTTATGGGPAAQVAPVAAPGAVSVATRNTTRLGGAQPAADAAAVARAVYPGVTATSRPQAVVLANQRDYPAALAASVLAATPTSAPLLFSDGDSLPAVSREALEAMHPTGARPLGGAQLIRVANSAAP